MTKTITHESEWVFQSRPIPINANDQYGCYVEPLERGYRELTRMLEHHNKVLAFRLDLHMSYETGDNRCVVKLFKHLNKRVRKRLNLKRLGYIWVREKETAKSQHYHVYIFVDGNKLQKPQEVIEFIEKIWTNMDQPKPFRPENHYKMIRRTGKKIDIESFDDVIYRMSYLAKIRGKGYKHKRANDFGTSQVRRKSLGSNTRKR